MMALDEKYFFVSEIIAFDPTLIARLSKHRIPHPSLSHHQIAGVLCLFFSLNIFSHHGEETALWRSVGLKFTQSSPRALLSCLLWWIALSTWRDLLRHQNQRAIQTHTGCLKHTIGTPARMLGCCWDLSSTAMAMFMLCNCEHSRSASLVTNVSIQSVWRVIIWQHGGALSLSEEL